MASRARAGRGRSPAWPAVALGTLIAVLTIAGLGRMTRRDKDAVPSG